MQDVTSSQMPDDFDREYGILDGLNETTRTGQTTKRYVPPLGVGGIKTFIVQTVRHREMGDTIFLEVVNGTRPIRLVIPPEVSNVIARQRDSLTTIVRRKAGRAAAAQRKLDGRPSPLNNPDVRRKALKARREKAAQRRAKREGS